MEEKEKKKKKKKGSGLKLFGKILLGIFIFIFLLLLFIRSPWGQNIIIDQVISYVKGKTDTEVSINNIYIGFGGDINIEGLYLEDEQGDTLVYSHELEADVPLWPLIRGTSFSIDNLEWSGVRANISRTDSLEGFNFDFLVEAFAPADTTATATPVDTTATAMTFDLGDLDLKDFKIKYNDQVLGIETRIDLGSLEADMQDFSLEEMNFEVADASLENTRFHYLQTKPFPASEDTTTGPATFFSAENLNLKNVVGDYQSIPDGILTDFDIDEFSLQLPGVDVENQEVLVDNVELQNSEILVKLTEIAPAAVQDTLAPEEPAAFEWPVWNVKADRVVVDNSEIKYSMNEATPQPGVFNPEAFSFDNLNLLVENFIMANQAIKADVERIAFQEISGLDLQESSFEFGLTEEKMYVENLDLRLNDNYVEGQLLVDYESFDAFLNHPETATVDLQIPQFNFDLSDIYKFQPVLRENPYFAALAEKDLKGSLFAEGKLSSVKIKEADVRWGATTSLAAEGTIFNMTDPDNLSFDIPRLQFSSKKSDIKAFLAGLDLGIELPEEISLAGSIEGNPEDLDVDAVLNSSAGDIAVDGRFSTAPGLAFDADIQVTQLELGQLLQMPELGPVTLELEGSGSGENINDLSAQVEGSIESFTYNQYEYNNIALAAELEDGEGTLKLDYKDDNLNMELAGFVELDSIAPNIALQLDLIGADLQALGLTERAINAALNLEAVFEGNAESFDAVANISRGIFVYDEDSYLLGDFDVLAHVRPDTTSVDIDNRMLNLRLSSNASPTDFIDALDRHYQSYFSPEETVDTVANPVQVEMLAEVSPSPILEEVFLPQLEELDTVEVRVDFNEKQRVLDAFVSLPHINYFGSAIDSLKLQINSDRRDLRFDLGWQSLTSGPLAIKETTLEGELVEDELLLEFNSSYEDEVLININSVIARNDDILNIHIVPENLVLNSSPWDINPENEILVGDEFWTFENFELTRNNQLLRATNVLPGVERDHVGLEFQNFKLAALTSFLNPEEVLVSGGVNGRFIVEEPFGETGLLADLRINEFGVLGVPMGVLILDAEAVGGNTYTFELAIKEGPANLELVGNYVANEQSANLDMKLDLIEVQMEILEGLSQGEITEAEGSFSGEIALEGTVAEPVYEGEIFFDDAAFTVAMLDAPFLLPDETLRLSNEGIFMDQFRILDMNRNELVLDGAVLTPNFLNPVFDISFNAEDFTALNSTEEDNDLFYGKAVFDATGSITGDLELPRVELELVVGEDTNMTYVIPPASLELETREGVVVFVNRENPMQILTQTEEEEEAIGFSGFLLNSYISLEENATFGVVLDAETGDHFQASGEGDLLFDIYPNGRSTLSGRIELQDGYYEMSLYDLVTRRFDIVEGSNIVWAGDIMDADLNITATYAAETSASALMAAQITGANEDMKDRFRQELEFLVYLYITGQISEPEIAFGLDMPEDEQGAIGGEVYGRIQQINEQPGELNKQVFSLLVLNRFFPAGGSDGSGGGTLAFARDNLNDALSDQLNIFSDRLLGDTGLDLNFGLDTFTDYQGENPQERTQLDIAAEKSFLDDRLTVSVGSEVDLQGSDQVGEESPVLGNVKLNYLLTRDGRFLLEAFRRKSYENVIDGQLIISGLALIFTQEFNKFNELWDALLKDEDEEQPEAPVEPEKTSM